jgi:nucleoid-associated protein YgaU
MTRETKVGVIVATSFLLLVGSVVFYKLYMVGDPAKYAGEDDLAQADEKSPAKRGDKLVPLDTKTPAASAKPESKPAPSDATAEKGAAPPPPEEEPVFAGKKDSRPPALPPGFDSKPSLTTRPETPSGRPGDSAASGSSGHFLAGGSAGASPSQPMRPDSGPSDSTGSGEAPPPPEAPSASGGSTRPGFDVKMPPPAERPGNASEPPPAVEEKRTAPPESGLPPLELPMRPDVKAPPPPEEAGPATSSPRGGADEKVMLKETGRPGFPPPPPPGPPSGDVPPGSGSRPADEARPPMGSDTPVPLSLPPEARGPADAGKKPAPAEDPLLRRGSPPPANTFDRTYDPPARLSNPSVDPGQASRPVPPDDGKRGIPVEIREQPEISGSPAPSGVRRSGNVTVYDEERYTARNGDTYASISLAKYGHERYGDALALYNRERNPRLVTPQPGLFVLVPPAQILERDYRHLTAGSSERPPAEAPPSSPPARRDTPVGYNTETSRPAPASTGVLIRSGEKTFRVRTGDTLWNISKQTLGNGERWVEILRLNRDQLPDINRLQDGMILRLPADARVDTASRPQ